VIIKHEEGSVITAFKYKSHTVLSGKPVSNELPGTFGDEDKVSTLVIHMFDPYTSLAADISYSVFPEHDAIVRNVKITNESNKNITVEKLASFSVDLPVGEYDMIGLRGDWSRERNQFRRRVEYGTQGYVDKLDLSQDG
jgi:alpha-galactosidase